MECCLIRFIIDNRNIKLNISIIVHSPTYLKQSLYNYGTSMQN